MREAGRRRVRVEGKRSAKQSAIFFGFRAGAFLGKLWRKSCFLFFCLRHKERARRLARCANDFRRQHGCCRLAD